MIMTWIISIYLSAFSPVSSGELLIRVSGTSSDKGKLLVGIYNRETGFPDMNSTYKNISLDARENQMMISIPDMPAGTYAIAIFHDENGNGKLDKNLLGIPTEPYGFSNNATGKFGPPSYKDCAFIVNVGSKKEISVKLR